MPRYAKKTTQWTDRNIASPTENQIQADFFTWIDLYKLRFPSLQLCYAIPNGSYKSLAARRLFQRTGLRAGVPDVHLPCVGYAGDTVPISKISANGLWIEFKTKRGPVSTVQAVWHERLRNAGHQVEICRSWMDAANIVIAYLNLPIERL